MDKRGTHVGIVLSFAIFVIFLVFLYSVIEPAIKTQKDKQALLDYLERELIEQTYSEMTIVTLKINETFEITKDCIKISDDEREIDVLIEEQDLIIKDESNNILDYYYQLNLYLSVVNASNKFIKIYGSDEFESEQTILGGCDNVQKKDYIIGLTRTETNIFEIKMIDLITAYEDNYKALKDELRISIGNEFGFSFTYSNGTKIKTPEKELSTSVYAKEIPIQYVDEEANINFGFMNIWVW